MAKWPQMVALEGSGFPPPRHRGSAATRSRFQRSLRARVARDGFFGAVPGTVGVLRGGWDGLGALPQGPVARGGGLHARFLCVLRGGLQGLPPRLLFRRSDRGPPIRPPTRDLWPLSGRSRDGPAIKAAGGVSGQPELFPGNVSGRRGNPGALARVGSRCTEPHEMPVPNPFPGGFGTGRSTACWTPARLTPTRPGPGPCPVGRTLARLLRPAGDGKGAGRRPGNARIHPVPRPEPSLARAHARVFLGDIESRFWRSMLTFWGVIAASSALLSRR